MGLKRAPAMEEAREDFPPVPLPFFPPNAAPARLVRVPFKPSLGQKCQQLWEVPLSQTKRILKFLQKKVDWSRGKVMSHRANKLHMPYLTISI